MNIREIMLGKVSFCAEGGFLQLFLGECKKLGAELFDVTVNGDGICAWVRQYDINLIFSAAKDSGMSISIIKRTGLPHIYLRYRKRLGVPVGMLVFILIISVLRSFIWSVDITGAENIPIEQIEAHLTALGVSDGSFCDGINCKDIEFSLYKNFPDINWVNVRLAGSRLIVDISERKVIAEYKDKSYSNVIAAKDGEIVRADIFSGEGYIYSGTAVVKGDLLVSGVINHRDGSVEFTDSNAFILARTKNFISSSIPLTVSVLKHEKCKDIYFPTFFGLSLLKLADVKNNYFTYSSVFFRSADITYPVGIVRLHTAQLIEEQISLAENQAVLLSFRDFSLNALKLYEKADVLSSQFAVSISDECEISAVFLCEEDIAQKKSFTVEEN